VCDRYGHTCVIDVAPVSKRRASRARERADTRSGGGVPRRARARHARRIAAAARCRKPMRPTRTPSNRLGSIAPVRPLGRSARSPVPATHRARRSRRCCTASFASSSSPSSPAHEPVSVRRRTSSSRSSAPSCVAASWPTRARSPPAGAAVSLCRTSTPRKRPPRGALGWSAYGWSEDALARRHHACPDGAQRADRSPRPPGTATARPPGAIPRDPGAVREPAQSGRAGTRT